MKQEILRVPPSPPYPPRSKYNVANCTHCNDEICQQSKVFYLNMKQIGCRPIFFLTFISSPGFVFHLTIQFFSSFRTEDVMLSKIIIEVQ